MAEIVELSHDEAAARLAELTDLLLDAVAGGASINFLAELRPEDAESFWRARLEAMPSGQTLIFAALEAGGVVGCVLLFPAWQPNQPHRADVSKLLVHRSWRRLGLATQLMDAMEARALALGRTLLTLDTSKGSGAEPLYSGRGYQRSGEIPGYALSTAGEPETAVFFYKALA